MNCREFQERLLEVDPLVLAAALGQRADRAVRRVDVPQDAFPDHLRTCPSCREATERVLADQEHLAASLAAMGPARPLEEAASAAIRESARRRRQLRWTSWTAAAAAVTGVMALRAMDVGDGFAPGTIEVAAATAGAQFMPEVEAMLDESVLVLETDNENVVVFWFYQGRGE